MRLVNIINNELTICVQEEVSDVAKGWGIAPINRLTNCGFTNQKIADLP
jgi:hypothetical protein